MMLPTHVLVGGFLGLSTLAAASGYLELAVLAGMAAAPIPDLDMFWEHRKTLHRPFQYLFMTAVAALFMVYSPSTLSVAFFFGLFSMTAHCFMEVLSNGKTMRPYEKKDERAIYNHFTGSWMKPWRLVLMGSPRDLVLALLSGGFLLYFTSGNLWSLVAVIMAWSILYFFLDRQVKERIPRDYDRFSEYFQFLLGRGPETR